MYCVIYENDKPKEIIPNAESGLNGIYIKSMGFDFNKLIEDGYLEFIDGKYIFKEMN